MVAKGKWQELLSFMRVSGLSKDDLSCVSESDLKKKKCGSGHEWQYMKPSSSFVQFLYSLFLCIGCCIYFLTNAIYMRPTTTKIMTFPKEWW